MFNIDPDLKLVKRKFIMFRKNINKVMAIDIQKIQDSPHLLDMLLQMEDVLDSLDVYVFKNWYLGEIAEGPIVRRYWLDFTLKYALDKMPDPKAAMRLIKHGVRVDYWKAKIQNGDFIDAENNDSDELEGKQSTSVNSVHGGKEDPAKNLVWLVRISIPRRLVAQMSSEEMNFYDEEVDVDDVEDAKDTGIDDESAYMDDGTGGPEGSSPGEAPPEEEPQIGPPGGF